MTYFINNAWLAWDLLAAVIVVLSIRICVHRGFARTIIGLLKYVVAAGVARALSPVLADAAFRAVVKDVIASQMARGLGDTLETGQKLVEQITGAIPAFLMPYILPEALERDVLRFTAMDKMGLIEAIVESAMRGPVVMMLGSLFFLLLFFVTVWVGRVLSGMLGIIQRIPVLGTVDAFLSGIVGALQAAMFLLVGSIVIRVALTMAGGSHWWFNSQVFERTYIWYIFMGVDLLGLRI